MWTKPFSIHKMLNFDFNYRDFWQQVDYSINTNRRPRENGPPLFLFFFFPFLLIVEFKTASRSAASFCASSRTAAAAAAAVRQMSRHHAAWRCELHLLVSTCGWLMCCFIYFLSCLSLVHPQMSLPMLCKSDHCLSLVLPFFISFSFSRCFPELTHNCYMRSRHLHYSLDKVCSVHGTYTWSCFFTNAGVEITARWEQQRPGITPPGDVVNSLVRIITKVCDSVWRVIRDRTARLFSREAERELHQTQCQSQEHSVMGNGAHLPNQLTLSAALSRGSCAAIMSEATSHLYSQDTSHRSWV